MKVNYDKVVWMTTEVDFLGYRLAHGQFSLRNFLNTKVALLGLVVSLKGFNRIIGILSYCRHHIPHCECVLAPLHNDLQLVKRKGQGTNKDWEVMEVHVCKTIAQALGKFMISHFLVETSLAMLWKQIGATSSLGS